MLAAVEFVEDRALRHLFSPQGKVGGAVAAACFERGEIGRAMPHGDILGYAPPLTLTRTEAGRIPAATKGAIEAVAATL
jgi:L-2,4-diaminobutyrate transaminase